MIAATAWHACPAGREEGENRRPPPPGSLLAAGAPVRAAGKGGAPRHEPGGLTTRWIPAGGSGGRRGGVRILFVIAPSLIRERSYRTAKRGQSSSCQSLACRAPLRDERPPVGCPLTHPAAQRAERACPRFDCPSSPTSTAGRPARDDERSTTPTPGRSTPRPREFTTASQAVHHPRVGAVRTLSRRCPHPESALSAAWVAGIGADRDQRRPGACCLGIAAAAMRTALRPSRLAA